MSIPQVAERWGKSTRLIRYWCAKGVFPHAFQIGNRWAIPHADVLLREGITGNAAFATR
jgi:predicted DNA-binding transcriptional regulator AlpA